MASIRKNSDGPSGWVIDYYDLKGSRKRKVVHCSKQEAEMLAKEIETKKSRIKLGFESSMNSDQLLTDSVKHYFRYKHNNPSTIRREKQIFNHLIEFIGNIKLNKVTFVMIDEYLIYRRDQIKISLSTLGIEFRTLRAFFNYFVDHNHISESPMKKMKHPKVIKKKIRFLTEGEIKKLMVVVDDENYRDLILMYLHTGARREELLKDRLEWKDIDFDRRNITLTGKGGKSRIIPLNETAYEILYRRRYIEGRSIPFEQNYEYMFKKIAKYYKAADIQDANIHVLRKTFGSTLCQKKLDIYTISKLMGHSSVRVTESHYAELLDKDLREGVKLLDS